MEQTEEYVLHTYNRFPVVMEKGEGVHLYDVDGKEYLDFAAGIAVFALGYKNVRINAAAFLQSGQQLILTGKFRYLFVQFNDIYTPEKFPFTDRLEVGDEVGQDVAALVLEIVIQPEECLLNLSFGDLGDGTGCFIFIVTAASPIPCAVDTTASAPGTAGAAQHFLKRTIRWCLDHLSAMPQRLCFVKYFL